HRVAGPGEHRCVVDRRDVDCGDQARTVRYAVVHEPADRAAQDAGKVRIVVRQVVEGDRAQRRLVLRNGGGAGQRQHAEYGIVCPVYVVLIAEVQRVAGLPAEDGDPGADQVRVVAVAERHAGTDGDRRRLLDVANRGAARDHRGQIRADFDVV